MAIAKISEIKASSSVSFDDAMKTGLARAKKTIRHIKSAWIKDFEVRLDEKGEISEYRILMRITFMLDD